MRTSTPNLSSLKSVGGAGHDFRLLFGIADRLFVAAFGIVADNFQKEGNVVGAALVADAFDEGILDVVDFLLLKRGVVEQQLDRVRALMLNSAHRPVIEQVGQTARGGGVVAGLLIGQQQTLAVAVLGGGQSIFRIEQNRGGVPGENFRHQRLEFRQRMGVDGSAFFLGQRLLQRTALIHGGGGNDAAFIGEGFHAGQFAGGELHRLTLLGFFVL